MSKTIMVTKYAKNGDQELRMKLGLRKPIQGASFKEQKEFVVNLLAAEPATVSGTYSVLWKDECGFEVGYLVRQ